MDYPVRTIDQLTPILRGFRHRRGLTQQELGQNLGITQKTVSALERKAGSMSVGRLLEILSVLDVELVLREKHPVGIEEPAPRSEW